MPEDRNILAVIGKLLQHYKKKKSEKKTQQGLESKLRTTQSLSKRESLLLDTQLKASSIVDRTDEGALMGLRNSPTGRQIGI